MSNNNLDKLAELRWPNDFVDKIICGDCLEIMGLIPDKQIDFVFADPPYGRNKANWDFYYPVGYEKEILRLAKNGVVITCGEKNIGEAITQLGDEYKAPIYAWNKNGMTRGILGYQNVIIALCAGKIKMGQNFIQFSIRDLSRKNHPAPKPIEYMRAIILRFSDPMDLVLDPFLGSGTTAVACKELGRHFIGIEINPEYCKIAEHRLAQTACQSELAITFHELDHKVEEEKKTS